MNRFGIFLFFWAYFILVMISSLIMTYGKVYLHACLATCFVELYSFLGIGVLISSGPGEMVGTRMMPAGSDSANSANWRDYLNLSPEEGVTPWGSELSRGGTCAFAADAPSGEPGPAAVPGIPDLNTPSVPEQPPLEPQGVSLEEILPVRERLRDYFQSLNVLNFPPSNDFLSSTLERLDIRPGTSSTRLDALNEIIETFIRFRGNGPTPYSWTRAILHLERRLEEWEDLNRGGVQSEAFKLLQDKVVRRHDLDSHSET